MFYSHAMGGLIIVDVVAILLCYQMARDVETKNKDEMYRIDRPNDLYISIDRPKHINRSKSILLMNH